MSRTTAFEKTRIGGSKVRTGCRTCKARRVKCDEGKPSCQRCIKAGRRCDGYAPSPEPRTQPAGHKFVHYVDPTTANRESRRSTSSTPSPARLSTPCLSRSPSPHADLDLSALRSLDFYINATALHLGEPFGIDLFSDGLSRMGYNDAAIRHSLVALAAFHETFMCGAHPVLNESRRLLALDHYNKSIQAVVQQNQSGSQHATLTTLVTCLLYCAIESVQGHFNSGMKHITAGIRLLAEEGNELLRQEDLGHGVSIGFVDTLRRLFVSLATQAMGIEDNNIDAAAITHLQSISKSIPEDYNFVTTQHALVDLSNLMNDIIRFVTWIETCHKEPGFPGDDLIQAGHTLDARFKNWTRQYHLLLTILGSRSPLESNPNHAALLILWINQVLNRIILEVKFDMSELGYDNVLEDFQEIIRLVEQFLEAEAQQKFQIGASPSSWVDKSYRPQPIFTLTLGVIPALFFTAARCRDQQTRRRALYLLKTTRRRESVWDANLVGVVAERLTDIEEACAIRHWKQQSGYDGDITIDISKAEYIPRTARVQELQIEFFGSEDSAQVSFVEVIGSDSQAHWLVWDAENRGGHFVPSDWSSTPSSQAGRIGGAATPDTHLPHTAQF